METSKHTASGADRLAPYLPATDAVTVFAAEWCGYCRALRKMLRDTEIAYREVMIEEDPVAEEIANEANGGDWIIPTVLYADGSTMVNPGIRDVAAKLAALSATTDASDTE